MSDKHDISVLNTLIAATLDNAMGFKDAAEDAASSRFATIFNKFVHSRGRVAASLQAEVRGLGGKPEDSISLRGAAHRSFIDLKQALAGKNDKAIIEEIWRGESRIREKFEEALKDRALRPHALMAILEGFSVIRSSQNRINQLKFNSLHAEKYDDSE